MVEQVMPKFSDFYGAGVAEYDQYNPLIPVEVRAEDIIVAARQKGFKTVVFEVEGLPKRRIICVDPGVNFEEERFGAVAFFEQEGRLFVNDNQKRYITNLLTKPRPFGLEGAAG